MAEETAWEKKKMRHTVDLCRKTASSLVLVENQVDEKEWKEKGGRMRRCQQRMPCALC